MMLLLSHDASDALLQLAVCECCWRADKERGLGKEEMPKVDDNLRMRDFNDEVCVSVQAICAL